MAFTFRLQFSNANSSTATVSGDCTPRELVEAIDAARPAGSSILRVKFSRTPFPPRYEDLPLDSDSSISTLGLRSQTTLQVELAPKLAALPTAAAAAAAPLTAQQSSSGPGQSSSASGRRPQRAAAAAAVAHIADEIAAQEVARKAEVAASKKRAAAASSAGSKASGGAGAALTGAKRGFGAVAGIHASSSSGTAAKRAASGGGGGSHGGFHAGGSDSGDDDDDDDDYNDDDDDGDAGAAPRRARKGGATAKPRAAAAGGSGRGKSAFKGAGQALGAGDAPPSAAASPLASAAAAALPGLGSSPSAAAAAAARRIVGSPAAASPTAPSAAASSAAGGALRASGASLHTQPARDRRRKRRILLPSDGLSPAHLFQAAFEAAEGQARGTVGRSVGAVDASLEFVRSAAQMEMDNERARATARDRLAAALAGTYTIEPSLAARAVGTGAAATLRVRFKGIGSRAWSEETIDNVGATAAASALVAAAMSGDEGSRDALKPHNMALVAVRTFWAVVRYGGAIMRARSAAATASASSAAGTADVAGAGTGAGAGAGGAAAASPLRPDLAVREGNPVDVAAAMRVLAPSVNWAFLDERARRLSAKAQEAAANAIARRRRGAGDSALAAGWLADGTAAGGAGAAAGGAGVGAGAGAGGGLAATPAAELGPATVPLPANADVLRLRVAALHAALARAQERAFPQLRRATAAKRRLEDTAASATSASDVGDSSSSAAASTASEASAGTLPRSGAAASVPAEVEALVGAPAIATAARVPLLDGPAAAAQYASLHRLLKSEPLSANEAASSSSSESAGSGTAAGVPVRTATRGSSSIDMAQWQKCLAWLRSGLATSLDDASVAAATAESASLLRTAVAGLTPSNFKLPSSSSASAGPSSEPSALAGAGSGSTCGQLIHVEQDWPLADVLAAALGACSAEAVLSGPIVARAVARETAADAAIAAGNGVDGEGAGMDGDGDDDDASAHGLETETLICDEATCGKARIVTAAETDLEAALAAERWTCGSSGIARLVAAGGCAAPDDELVDALGGAAVGAVAALACDLLALRSVKDVASAALPDSAAALALSGSTGVSGDAEAADAATTAFAAAHGLSDYFGAAARSAPSASAGAGAGAGADTAAVGAAGAGAVSVAQGRLLRRIPVPGAVALPASLLLLDAEREGHHPSHKSGAAAASGIAAELEPQATVLPDAVASSTQLPYLHRGFQLLYAAAAALVAAARAAALTSDLDSVEGVIRGATGQSAPTSQLLLQAASLLSTPLGWLLSHRVASAWQRSAQAVWVEEAMLDTVLLSDSTTASSFSGSSAVAAGGPSDSGGAAAKAASTVVSSGAIVIEGDEEHDEPSKASDADEDEADSEEAIERRRTAYALLERLRIRTPADLVASTAEELATAIAAVQAQGHTPAAGAGHSSLESAVSSSGGVPAQTATQAAAGSSPFTAAEIAHWRSRAQELIGVEPWLADVLSA